MPRGKANKQLTVGKKLEIIAEADECGSIAATAQKYGVQPGQIRNWKKNIDRLRATDPSRLVCASSAPRGGYWVRVLPTDTVEEEEEEEPLKAAVQYAEHHVGPNKVDESELEGVEHDMHITYKEVYRQGVRSFETVERVNPTAKHALEYPGNNGFYRSAEDTKFLVKDMKDVRAHLNEFFGKPFATKYMYYVTRLDFVRPDFEGSDDEDEEDEEEEDKPRKEVGIDDYISFYVAVCGDGSVLTPMAVFPPVKEDQPVKLRNAHSMHRTKMGDPSEALEFFAVTWKKFQEKAKTSEKFAVLLDRRLGEFHKPEFENGIKALDGYGTKWTTTPTWRNPIDFSNFDSSFDSFVRDEWRKLLGTKESDNYRASVAFWFFLAWKLFAGTNARASFRGCNMYLEAKKVWKWGDFDNMY